MIKVVADGGRIDSGKAIGLGLIVTELVINAIKYAFPAKKGDALVLVTYEICGLDWKLVVSDNGVGKNSGEAARSKAGLGTAIVNALVLQLDAQLEVVSSGAGMSVSVSRGTITSHLPRAA